MTGILPETSSSELAPIKRKQKQEYVLKFTLPDDEILNGSIFTEYYSQLLDLEITDFEIYQSKTNNDEYIFYIKVEKRRDIRICNQGIVVSPQKFHLKGREITYLPRYENESPLGFAKQYKDISKYDRVYNNFFRQEDNIEITDVKKHTTLEEHVENYAFLKSHTEKMTYLKENKLFFEGHRIHSNSIVYNYLDLMSRKDRGETLNDNELHFVSNFILKDPQAYLLTITNQLPAVEKEKTFAKNQDIDFFKGNMKDQEIDSSTNNMKTDLQKFIISDSKEDLSKKHLMEYVFSSENEKEILDLLNSKKQELNNPRKYSSLFKVLLNHYKISRTLYSTKPNKFLHKVYTFLPESIKEEYRKYLN